MIGRLSAPSINHVFPQNETKSATTTITTAPATPPKPTAFTTPSLGVVLALALGDTDSAEAAFPVEEELAAPVVNTPASVDGSAPLLDADPEVMVGAVVVIGASLVVAGEEAEVEDSASGRSNVTPDAPQSASANSEVIFWGRLT